MPAGLRSGRPVRRVLLAALLTSTLAIAQTPPKKAAHRANELRLCGLRPGKDNAANASRMYRHWLRGPETKEDQLSWWDQCHGLALMVDLDVNRKIQVLRLTKWAQAGDCFKLPPWKTGIGLRVGDASAKVAQLYGEPDSRSPLSSHLRM